MNKLEHIPSEEEIRLEAILLERIANTRTLYLNENIANNFSGSVIFTKENPGYTKEDVLLMVERINQDLNKNGPILWNWELLRVKFSREVADIIGGKKIAKDFFRKVFDVIQSQDPTWPQFLKISLSPVK